MAQPAFPKPPAPRTIEPQGNVIMPGEVWAGVEDRLAAHEDAMAELRRDLDRALEERAEARAKLGDALADASKHLRAYHAEVSEKLELETLLDALSPDWRTDYWCDHCEARIALPDHALCSKCESDAEAAVEDRAQRLWEDRA